MRLVSVFTTLTFLCLCLVTASPLPGSSHSTSSTQYAAGTGISVPANVIERQGSVALKIKSAVEGQFIVAEYKTAIGGNRYHGIYLFPLESASAAGIKRKYIIEESQWQSKAPKLESKYKGYILLGYLAKLKEDNIPSTITATSVDITELKSLLALVENHEDAINVRGAS